MKSIDTKAYARINLLSLMGTYELGREFSFIFFSCILMRKSPAGKMKQTFDPGVSSDLGSAQKP